MFKFIVINKLIVRGLKQVERRGNCLTGPTPIDCYVNCMHGALFITFDGSRQKLLFKGCMQLNLGIAH